MELLSLDCNAKKGQRRGQKRQKGREMQSWGRCTPTLRLLGAGGPTAGCAACHLSSPTVSAS